MISMNFGAGAGYVLRMLSEKMDGNYLFLGKSGLHKADYARKMIQDNLGVANLEYCPDYFEVICEEKSIGVDDVMEIIPFLETLALAERKYCLIPHAERLTDAAGNALLKMIEESENVSFVFVSKSKLMDTIMSRVRTIQCFPLTAEAFNECFPDADMVVSRFVCGRAGAYEAVMKDCKQKKAAEKIVTGMDSMQKPRDILEIFSVVREKDPDSVFEMGSEFLSMALDYVSKQLMQRFQGKGTLPYDTDRCLSLLELITEADLLMRSGKFGKNEFFSLIRKFAV